MTKLEEMAARLRKAKLAHIGVNPDRFPYDRCPEQEKLEWEAIARVALVEASATDEHDPEKAIAFGYTNWRGEKAERGAIPIGITWGSTEWHPEPGWLLNAYDIERQAERQFALKDCDFTITGQKNDIADSSAAEGK